MKTIYLDPGGPFKNELHSDTLFGMICWGICQVFSAARLEELLAEFNQGRPPFLLSSAFPYAEQEEGLTHFLPRPLVEPPVDAGEKEPTIEDADLRKQFKKVRWIPADHFNEFLQGRVTQGVYYRSQVWQKTRVPSIERHDRLQNTLDRLSGRTDGSGTLYTATEYHVRNGGLYFLLKEDPDGLVEGALRFLEDFGLGGRNSTGYGRFTVRVEDRTVLEESSEPDRFITLSLYHPTTAEAARWKQASCWYELTLRKGKVGGHFLRVDDFWKRSVMMFAPGSNFPLVDDQIQYGCNPIVKGKADGLPFDVQQMGYAFTARMKTATE